MASTSSSHQQNAFSGIEPPNKRRRIEESSRVHDVFINHRGPDVKETLATQLYNSLKDLEIKAFLDSEEKELGDSFPSTIETAICSAKVQIAIFSPTYAESPWCLAELVLMLQSQSKIVPVFYKVKPADLRHIENGAYAEAFIKHEEKGRYHEEKLKAWKEALEQVSYIAGYEFKENSDARDCRDILSAVEKEVDRTKLLHVAKHPVGLDKLVNDFERRCLDELVEDFESQCGMKRPAKGKANVVGIFGMGGVGKTTLSKELFNQKKPNYTRASFLFDVREAYARGTLPLLQSQLVKDIFSEGNRGFPSNTEGTSYLRDLLERSSNLSFLIVLDDIDHVEQIEALLPIDILNKRGYNDHLVIITTRDVSVLVNAGIDIAYHLRGFGKEDGRELFCWHAFTKPYPLVGYEYLVQDFVDVCRGLPLSLIVLGRHVSRRPQLYWQGELEKVRKALPRDVKKSLKISFDALENEEKQIFMDIACFFIDESVNKAISIWNRSGWTARCALETLKERCLVEEVKIPQLENKWEFSTDGYGSALRMHDHLRDLGREMADELWHPHRVWRPQYLKSMESQGFQTILAKIKGRCFHSIVDKSMSCKITFLLGEPEDGSHTSPLLWLQLEYLSDFPLDLNSDIYPAIPSWIPLQYLQCLRISNGGLQKLWPGDVQAPSHLKELQIRDTILEELPNFIGKSNNIEKLIIHARQIKSDIWSFLEPLRMNLRSFVILDSAVIGDLANNDFGNGTTAYSLYVYHLRRLWEGQVALNNRETIISNLENLEIDGCTHLTEILIDGNCCQHQQSLKICSCLKLEELRFTHLSCLKKLTVLNCNRLKSVSRICNLAQLVELKISGSHMLEMEEQRFTHLKYLERVTVDGYVKMEHFELDSCEKLREIMFDCKNVVKLSIRCCAELEKLSDLTGPSFLKKIIIDGCGNLKNLRLNGLENLESVSGNLELRQMYIIKCPELEELPSLAGLNCMEKIEIECCQKLQNIRLPTTLDRLSVKGCRVLQRMAGIADATKLTRLSIVHCPELEELPSFARLNCLEEIKIECWEKLQNITLPTTLVRLSVKGCRVLQRMAGIADATKLALLSIVHCPELEELPSFARLNCLQEIKIECCEKLQSITLPTTLIRLSVKGCRVLQRIAGLTDVIMLTNLRIAECAEFEFPCLDSCENLQNVSAIEALHVPSFTILSYCSSSVTRCFIDQWKSVPIRACFVGKAVDGAELSLNVHLFSDANIAVDRVTEISTDNLCRTGSPWDPFIVCYMVVIDSSTLAGNINKEISDYSYDIEMRQGESMVTLVGSWYRISIMLTKHAGILKKGFRVDLKEDEEWKCLPLLRTIVDRLYDKE